MASAHRTRMPPRLAGAVLLLLAGVSFPRAARADQSTSPATPGCGDERAAWQKQATLTTATALADCELAAGHVVAAATVLVPFANKATRDNPESTRARHVLDSALAPLFLVTVEVDLAGRDVFVDGVKTGVSPLPAPLVLQPGRHTITAAPSSLPSARHTIEGGPGESQGVFLRTVPLSAQAIGFDAPASDSEIAPPGRPRVPVLIAGAVLAVAAISTGVALTVAASSESGHVSDARAAVLAQGGDTSSCLSPTAAFAAQCGALSSARDARTQDVDIADAAFVGGAVVVAATLAYWFWPRSVAAVRPSPFAGSHMGGVTLGGSF